MSSITEKQCFHTTASLLILLYEKQSPGTTLKSLNAGVSEEHEGLAKMSSLEADDRLAMKDTEFPGRVKHSFST
jgi:hypothetical protein